MTRELRLPAQGNNSEQKAKQKSAMKEIVIIATACADYITDRGSWVETVQDGPLTAGNPFMLAIGQFWGQTPI